MYVQSIWNKQAVTEYRERRNEARVMMPQGGRVTRVDPKKVSQGPCVYGKWKTRTS